MAGVEQAMAQPITPDYGQQFLFPPALEDWVPTDHPARFLREFVEQLDLSTLGFAMPVAVEGRPPCHPSLLLKIWLYGYYHRIRSTRKLETACREHLSLLWLCASNVFAATGATAPCAPAAPATPKAGRLKSGRTGRKFKRCGGDCKTRTHEPSGNNAPGSSNHALGRSNNTTAFGGGRYGDWKASRPNGRCRVRP